MSKEMVHFLIETAHYCAPFDYIAHFISAGESAVWKVGAVRSQPTCSSSLVNRRRNSIYKTLRAIAGELMFRVTASGSAIIIKMTGAWRGVLPTGEQFNLPPQRG